MHKYPAYYHSWYGLIYHMLKWPFQVFIGFILYMYFVKKKEDTHYLVLPKYLGDTLCALAYLHEYKKQKKYPHITVIACPSVKQLCDFYTDDINNIVFLSSAHISDLQEFACSLAGKSLNVGKYRTKITFALYSCNLSPSIVWDNNYIHLSQYVKEMLYKIGPNATAKFPQIPFVDVEPFVQRYGLKKGRTVLLNPYANSIICDVVLLFESLAKELIQKGYTVVSLTGNKDQAPVKGTLAVPCSLKEAYWLAEYCGNIIALRSGFLDFILFSSHCRIIAVVDPRYGRKEFFNLKKWNINPECYTIEYKDNYLTAECILKHFIRPVIDNEKI
ncbi:MAG: hypothetical protein HFG53_10390 [Lachnospiraceae bacterium]|jgi:hypothetical protein|nr:hypothetical protein [Lachnospiraceae bacterium]